MWNLLSITMYSWWLLLQNIKCKLSNLVVKMWTYGCTALYWNVWFEKESIFNKTLTMSCYYTIKITTI